MSTVRRTARPRPALKHTERRSTWLSNAEARAKASRSAVFTSRKPMTVRDQLTRRGTDIRGGRIWEDPNPDMRNVVEAQGVYTMMERTDPIIGGAALMFDGVLQTARLDLEPANRTQVAGRVAQFVDWALNVTGKRRPSGRRLAEMLRPLQSFAWRGFAYSEILPKVIEPRTGPFRGKPRVVLEDLVFCDQSAHGEWVTDEQGRNLIGITQRERGEHWMLPNLQRRKGRTYNGRPIVPIQRLIRVALQQRGHDYNGIAVYRRLVYTWRAKNSAMDSGLVAIKRFGAPTPVVEYDRKMAREAGYSEDAFQNMAALAAENLEHYFVDENGFLEAYPGISWKTFGDNKVDSTHIVGFVRQCNRELTLGMLAQFMELGIGDVGSRSVGEIHRSVHAQFGANLMDIITKAVTEQVIFAIVVANFGLRIAEENTPRLTHHDIDAALLERALGVLPSLVQAGIIKVTQALENEVLKVLGGPRSSHGLIQASEATPESMRAVASGGIHKPGPGRPRGDEG